MAGTEETSAVARRCIEDPDYARTVLQGHDYPEVRQALAADLGNADEVKGFLNPQPIPPGGVQGMDPSPQASPIEFNWEELRSRWPGLEFGSTRSIIIVGG